MRLLKNAKGMSTLNVLILGGAVLAASTVVMHKFEDQKKLSNSLSNKLNGIYKLYPAFFSMVHQGLMPV